jgi:hypothetical protein
VMNGHGRQWMHDLTVAEIHTYYIVAGTTPVLVHNCGGGSPGAGLKDDPYHPDVVEDRIENTWKPWREAEEEATREALAREAARIARAGNAPHPISRIDAPNTNVRGSQWHAQERGQGSPGMNRDGSIHDQSPHRWPAAALDWLERFGWDVSRWRRGGRNIPE